jgi:hypothetical protein
MSTTALSNLSSLTTWLEARLFSVYTEFHSTKADFDNTFDSIFSPSVEILVNHDPVSRDNFRNDFWNVAGSNVEWDNVTELPKDPQNPVGVPLNFEISFFGALGLHHIK